MRTLCPFPQCRYEHRCSSDDTISSLCPKCGRTGAVRHPEIWRVIYTRVDAFTRVYGEKFQIRFDKPGRLCCVVLEDIRSLWNVGSIFRTADAAGVGQLVLAGITGAPPRKEIAKTSLGAEDHVAWSYVGHTLDIVPILQEHGVMVVALERCTGAQSVGAFVDALAADQKIAIVLGNEVTGVSPETLSVCDAIVDLPMCGVKESLNVAVAFGVAAYALNFFLAAQNTGGNTGTTSKSFVRIADMQITEKS